MSSHHERALKKARNEHDRVEELIAENRAQRAQLAQLTLDVREAYELIDAINTRDILNSDLRTRALKALERALAWL